MLIKATFVYQGKEYPTEIDFGEGYPEEAARYMLEDGNYSCDCNRSLIIRDTHPEFPELGCGDEISMTTCEVVDGKP